MSVVRPTHRQAKSALMHAGEGNSDPGLRQEEADHGAEEDRNRPHGRGEPQVLDSEGRCYRGQGGNRGARQQLRPALIRAEHARIGGNFAAADASMHLPKISRAVVAGRSEVPAPSKKSAQLIAGHKKSLCRRTETGRCRTSGASVFKSSERGVPNGGRRTGAEETKDGSVPRAGIPPPYRLVRLFGALGALTPCRPSTPSAVTSCTPILKNRR